MWSVDFSLSNSWRHFLQTFRFHRKNYVKRGNLCLLQLEKKPLWQVSESSKMANKQKIWIWACTPNFFGRFFSFSFDLIEASYFEWLKNWNGAGEIVRAVKYLGCTVYRLISPIIIILVPFPGTKAHVLTITAQYGCIPAPDLSVIKSAARSCRKFIAPIYILP